MVTEDGIDGHRSTNTGLLEAEIVGKHRPTRPVAGPSSRRRFRRRNDCDVIIITSVPSGKIGFRNRVAGGYAPPTRRPPLTRFSRFRA